MLNSFTGKLLGIVLLQGVFSLGVFAVYDHKLSRQHSQAQTAAGDLYAVSDAATDLHSELRVAALTNLGALQVTFPNQQIEDAYDRLLQVSEDTPFETRVKTLGSSSKSFIETIMEERRFQLEAVQVPLAEPGAFRGSRDVRIRDSVVEIARAARNLAIEKGTHGSGATSDIWPWTVGLLSILVLSAAAVFGISQRLVRHIVELPKQVEALIYDKATASGSERQVSTKDPVAKAMESFRALATRLRTRLSENEKIERMAFTDPLTGLPNRRGLLAFLDRLAQDDVDDADDGKIGLVHIDLDHFKTINDTMGHDAGDTVLREATKRMSTAIRDSDLLARLGGDEFLVVATGIECEADLTRIADRLTSQFKAPMLYRQRVCHVGVSMGLVLGGQRGRVRDPKRLLINADMALFRAKSMGRGRYAIFNSAMADEARLRNERSLALGVALQNDAFRPWFQPILDVQAQRVKGLELLCRWHDEARGVVMPDGFIEDAEANSLMEDIGLRVLEHAISAIQDWRLSGAETPTIHLNLSRTQLLSSSFVDRLSWTLDEANLPPGQFAIEIDERVCDERGSEVVFANVRRMRDLGLEVVLDNFGAEEANLKAVRSLRARMVKCDASVFEDLLSDQDETKKVMTLAALKNAAAAFDIRIGAKGVETEQQSEMLSMSGVKIQQGDYVVGVLNAEDTGRYLRGELEGIERGVRFAS